MATTSNPQDTYIVEIIHKTLQNIVFTKGLEELEDL